MPSRQMELFSVTRKKLIKPNTRLLFVKQNIQRERNNMKIKQISTKIQAYELAWVIINSGLFRGGRELVQEAWHIVKTLSPARGKSKVGRAAKFRRIYGATPTNPRGLELEKLNSKTANWFVEYAKRELDIKRATK